MEGQGRKCVGAGCSERQGMGARQKEDCRGPSGPHTEACRTHGPKCPGAASVSLFVKGYGSVNCLPPWTFGLCVGDL